MDISAEPRTGGAVDAVPRHIVQVALRIAQEKGSWDAVHVHAVARKAGISLEELRQHFGDKDAIAEGLFDLADEALLAMHHVPGWSGLPARERLYTAYMAWFDALAPHRRIAREMLRYKLHPEHIHLQARGIARISRTVQWIRETAQLPSTGWRRELEEAALTTIYLTAFSSWLLDSSPDAGRTKRLLRRLLRAAERGAGALAIPGR
jgi:ubiquinone biosynthesis protein COQ9